MLRVLDQQRLFVTAAADGLSRWIALNVRGEPATPAIPDRMKRSSIGYSDSSLTDSRKSGLAPYRVAPAFFSPSRARSEVIGPMTTSRIVPWPSMKNVAGGPKMR